MLKEGYHLRGTINVCNAVLRGGLHLRGANKRGVSTQGNMAYMYNSRRLWKCMYIQSKPIFSHDTYNSASTSPDITTGTLITSVTSIEPNESVRASYEGTFSYTHRVLKINYTKYLH